jgi:hypothetical protein
VTEPNVAPLNKGGYSQKEQTSRTAKELIETEWRIIDKLQKLADDPNNASQSAFYYQTLASHVRTLSMLLKLHAQPDTSQDLAKILSQITTKAKTLAKRLKQK